jgi:hypothetical protein
MVVRNIIDVMTAKTLWKADPNGRAKTKTKTKLQFCFCF